MKIEKEHLTADQLFASAMPLIREHRLDDAQRLLLLALEKGQSNPNVLNKLGFIQFLKKHYREAINYYEAAIAIEPRAVEPLHNIALCYKHVGEYDLALESVQAVLELAPNTPIAFNTLGEILAAQGDFDEAVKVFELGLKLDARIVAAHVNLGDISRQLGDFGQAGTHYSNAIAVAPNALSLRLKRAKLKLHSGDYRGAIDDCDFAGRAMPNHWEPHYVKGAALQNLGENKPAIEQFLKVLDLRPGFAPAHNNLGVLYQNVRNFEQSRHHYEAAIEVDPEYATAIQNLGEWHQRQGSLDQAIKLFRKSVALALVGRDDQVPEKRSLYSPDAAERALTDLHHLLNDAGIPFFLTSGTLLGVVRDGKLIEHDKDIDIGLSWESDRHALMECLSESFTLIPHRLDRDISEHWKTSFVHTDTGVFLDCNFFKQAEDGVLSGFDHLPQPCLSVIGELSLQNLEWQGRQWSIPNPVEPFLKSFYGPDWRSPDKYFDKVLSNKGRLDDSLDIRRCYGYNRLYGAIMGKDGARAESLVAQLLELKEDSFLENLDLADI